MKQENWRSQDDSILLESILHTESNWRGMLSHLLGRHHQALLLRCRAYLKNREDAEDATQETELRAFKAIHLFRGDSTFRTWLFAIADRQCHDLAAKRRTHVLTEHIEALVEIAESGQRQRLDEFELTNSIARAMDQLPGSTRTLIELRFYRDYSLDEIALTCGIGLSAAKMRLYRALEQCAATLSQEEETLLV